LDAPCLPVAMPPPEVAHIYADPLTVYYWFCSDKVPTITCVCSSNIVFYLLPF